MTPTDTEYYKDAPKAKSIEYRERLNEMRGGLTGTAPTKVHFWDSEWDIDECLRAYIKKQGIEIKHHVLTHVYKDGSTYEVNVDTIMKLLLFVNPDVKPEHWNKTWEREVPTIKLFIREWGEEWRGTCLRSLEAKFHKECKRLEKTHE